jgi:hypothetical protein
MTMNMAISSSRFTRLAAPVVALLLALGALLLLLALLTGYDEMHASTRHFWNFLNLKPSMILTHVVLCTAPFGLGALAYALNRSCRKNSHDA